MRLFVKGLFLSVPALLILVTMAGAHGTGQSFPKDTGDFTVELEYGEPELIAGESTAFSFRILDKDTGAGENFDFLLVRFEKKDDRGSVLTARLVKDDLIDGLARLTTTLPAGEYTVILNFKEGGKTLAETSYELSVINSYETGKLKIGDDLLAGILGGFLTGFVLGRLLFRKNLKR
jgi:hypothetical protein